MTKWRSYKRDMHIKVEWTNHCRVARRHSGTMRSDIWPRKPETASSSEGSRQTIASLLHNKTTTLNLLSAWAHIQVARMWKEKDNNVKDDTPSHTSTPHRKIRTKPKAQPRRTTSIHLRSPEKIRNNSQHEKQHVCMHIYELQYPFHQHQLCGNYRYI